MEELPRDWHSDPHFALHWGVPGADDVCLMLHGVESHSQWFTALAKELNGVGMAALAFDRQGFGRSPGTRGHLPNADAAFAEMDGALAWAAGRYQRVHLVGLSWGGLLGAAARERWPGRLATVTLVVPALFPLRRPNLRSIGGAVFGRPAALPIVVEDFTNDPASQKFIADDPWRVQAVTLSFLWTTRQLLRSVHRSFMVNANPSTQILLAEHDRLIDTPKTQRLARDRKVPVEKFANTVHSLVLEEPAKTALAIQRLRHGS